MGLIAKVPTGNGNYEPVPEGLHHAVCYRVTDLGTHATPWDTMVRKVLVSWELPQERIDFERDGVSENLPRVISKKYTLSLHDKANLRRDLENWRGKKFTAQELTGWDLKKIIGANCFLQVLHKETKEGRTFADVSSIVGLPKKTEKLNPENETAFFSFDDGGDIPEDTPEWITTLIKESVEWQQRQGRDTDPPPEEAVQTTEEGDDIPF